MSPEKICGSNMWWLFPDEFVEGVNGRGIKRRIEVPGIVRVLEFPELKKLSVQRGNRKIEVEGTDFESVVQKK